MQTINDRKCLASWAVFKKLCDEGHKNIYEVLRDFIKGTIYRNSLRSFTAASLTGQVNKDYEFNLKTAVVAYAIRDLALTRDANTGTYDCDPATFADEADIEKQIEESSTKNNEILDGLFAYIEQERGVALNESEKESIVQSFINYLLNNSYEDSNSTVISAYILRCRQDKELSEVLTNIIEGVVRYVGVNYDSPISASSRWTDELTIYLDTELLFHMAGFNGTLYKQLFDDFYELIEEINKDSLKQRDRKLITLRYFDYVVEEIDKFFDRAKDIINGKLALNPSITAMKEITLGCKTESEVAEKKGLFLAMIKEHGIEPDNNSTEFYHSSNYGFNLEDDSIIEKYCNENNYKRKKFVQDSLLSLSHINVLRQGISNRSFERIGYVLLTDNYITERVAWMEDVKKNDEKPLCTNLYYVTNRIWYRLGKAFGNNVTPKVFDVISKAQIILSNRINDSVYAQYEKLVEKMDNNEISSSGALEVLYQLRNQVKNPEEIDSTNEVENAMKSISEPELQKYIEEAEFKKTKLKQAEEENQRLLRINEQVVARNEEVVRDNNTIRSENDSVKRENELYREDIIQKTAQLEAKNKENTDLKERLKESNEKIYKKEIQDYNDKKNDYIKKRKKQTKWQLALFIIFLVISIGLAFLVAQLELLPSWPKWIKNLLSIILLQVFPLIRGYVTKINLNTIWQVIFKKDVTLFENEFIKDHLQPVLLEDN